MSVTVSTAFTPSLGVLTHSALAAPAIPTPTPVPSVEMTAIQLWAPGYALNMNNLTMRSITTKDPVNHMYQPIVLDAHQCGPMIPDLTPPVPANQWYAVMWPLSEREFMFSASTVKMNGEATGCAQTVGIPPLPLMTCGDPVSAPTALMHPLQLMNSVSVGFTWADLAKGVLSIAASMALDFLFMDMSMRKWAKGFTRSARQASRKAWKDIANDVVSNMSNSTKRLVRRGLRGDFGQAGKDAAQSYLRKQLRKQARRQARKEVKEELVSGHVAPTDANGWAKKGLGHASDFGINRAFDEEAKAKFDLGGPFANAEASTEVSSGGGETFQEEKVEGNVLGWQRDTSGGGANWGETMPGPDS